jgi:hypothetical protein
MGERTLISFDYAVKFLLRGKSSDDFVILNGFLSELMGRKIEVTDILESESNKSAPDEKTNISTPLNDRRVDLKAQIDGGEFAVFEIQFLQKFDFLGRVLYGVSRSILEQVYSGELCNIKKVHSINVAYYMKSKREYLFTGKFGGFHGVHFEEESIQFAQAADEKSEELVEIHPEYYLILPDMFDEKLRGKFDEWIYVLKKSKVRDDFTAAGIKEAKAKLDYLSMPPDERLAYERYMDSIRSQNSIVIAAEVRGKVEGRAEGRAEGAANVLELLNQGIPIDEIKRRMGL